MERPTDQLEEFAKEHPAGRLKLLVKQFGVFPFVLVVLLLVAIPIAVFMYLHSVQLQRDQFDYQLAQFSRLQTTLRTIDSEISDLRATLANPEKPPSRDDLLQRVDRLGSAIDQLHNEVIKGFLRFLPRSEAPASPSGLIGAAHAQPVTAPVPQPAPSTAPVPQPTAPSRRVSEDMRTWIMVSVFVVLGMTLVISIVAIFKTANAEVLRFAFDTIKTLIGFFIGVATTLIGTS